MSRRRHTYALITPARNEATNLPRLAASLAAQTQLPDAWVVVDNGSSDDTYRVLDTLAETTPWLRLAPPVADRFGRGGPIVRAFQAGLEELVDPPDVVVKLDADTSFPPSYFERLLDAFAADGRLGIASGNAWELADGRWVERRMTGGHVWGAARAYRWACLQDVLPLDEQMGWDGIDALKARMHGWRTETLVDLPFRHHRAEGERDGARRHAWAAQGRAARYMGYRFSYLVLRALHHARREPVAVAMIWGYVRSTLEREPVCADVSVRRYLRGEQRLRKLPSRIAEATRPPSPSPSPPAAGRSPRRRAPA